MKMLLAVGSAALLLASAISADAAPRTTRAGGVNRPATVHGGAARVGYAGRVGSVGVTRGGYYGRGYVGRGYGLGVAAAAATSAAAYGTYAATSPAPYASVGYGARPYIGANVAAAAGSGGYYGRGRYGGYGTWAEYARVNGFKCQPGTTTQMEDGATHLCQ
jgi:hypothetical protein